MGVNSSTPLFGGLCSHPNERIQKAIRREQQQQQQQQQHPEQPRRDEYDYNDDSDDDDQSFVLPEFVFAVNLCIPMNNTEGSCIDPTNTNEDAGYYHAVFYFGADKDRMEEINAGTTPFGRVMNKFIYGDESDDEFRNGSFKLI